MCTYIQIDYSPYIPLHYIIALLYNHIYTCQAVTLSKLSCAINLVVVITSDRLVYTVSPVV